ncbi:anaphase-promoting complex subunit Cut9 [Schizosaccharomyces octosporus yFS286]|uniref:Anaphase-promoting complex subunit Cut9 n=1 Tax=Schizosaccharomyces octosporus (strain yFS286) TaxID=483514 RepID=S9Q3Y3_SCHOY|nr:anaphase-promoting complex subunit Cut9 [Schizosaccharomyces octosporus yFS286]EPX74797.1 anaphase-promoting complex subunit Cut9 [Schizosaccharomyces octosporus yFS286]
MMGKRSQSSFIPAVTPSSFSQGDSRPPNAFMTPPSMGAPNVNNSNSQMSTLTISPMAYVANTSTELSFIREKNLSTAGLESLSREEYLRMWRHDALMQQQYKCAAFVGEKVLDMTKDSNDAFWLAQVYCCTGDYARAKSLLTKEDLCNQSSACRYLAAFCFVKLFDWQGALELLGETNPFSKANGNSDKLRMQDGGIKLEASMCYLRGQVYTNLSDFDRAKDCYKEALMVDTKCFEAFDQLVSNHLLTASEEWELVSNLDYSTYSKEDSDFLKSLYMLRLNKTSHEPELRAAEDYLTSIPGLENNADLLISKAESLIVRSRFVDVISITSKILESDPYNMAVYPIHLASLHEMGEKNKLFLISHDLVDRHPEKAVTWLAVGIYYLSVNKVQEARRYFSKSSTIDPQFGPAWIGFAHSFAIEGEHDQAISAYTTAARLFQGTHLPYLFLGMQHMQLGNISLADEYLRSSYSLFQYDPLLLNEMGVVAFNKSDMQQSIKFFNSALQLVKKTQSNEKPWAATWANLGHAYRKLKMFDEAIDALEQGLVLSTQDASIHTAIALVYMHKKMPGLAITHLHESLAISQNEIVASDLLRRALEENSLIPAVPDELVYEDAVSEYMQQSTINASNGNVIGYHSPRFDETLNNNSLIYVDTRSEMMMDDPDNDLSEQ